MITIRPEPGLRINESCRFEPGEYIFDGKDGLIIEGDGIVIEGNGAVLHSIMAPPTIPEGDHYYTPGSMGKSDEEAELRTRKIVLSEKGAYSFEYTCWGMAGIVTKLEYSRDGNEWIEITTYETQDEEQGWILVRYTLGILDSGPFILKFTIPPGGAYQKACFFDDFSILKDGTVFWHGDAMHNWDKWYNTGFSIYKRDVWKSYGGIALRSQGNNALQIRGCKVQGFDLALSLVDCCDCIVEGNDFSDNFSDADYGWGDGREALGGIFLDTVTGSKLNNNKVHNVWNGLVLRNSSNNDILDNDVSRCSNVCLKMSQSSNNRIKNNIFSWGLRIYPGEVHARDSVSFLMESGSNNNIIENNDFSHGGDGIFIRVLNHWCSMGNVFKGNDCSWANNNAIESWSPGNRYYKNKANHSSYGFWLGGSDDTVLIENEAIGNGIDFKNAPEPYGNAGVAVVHGSSNGFLMVRNRIHGNHGPGLSLGYKADAPAWHWLISGNDISSNEAWSEEKPGLGILVENAADIHLMGNTFHANDGSDLVVGKTVSNLFFDNTPVDEVQELEIRVNIPVLAGHDAVFVVDPKPGCSLEGFVGYRWSKIGSESVTTHEPRLMMNIPESGLITIGVIAYGHGKAGTASRMFWALPENGLSQVAGDVWHLLTDGRASKFSCFSSDGVTGKPYPMAVIRNGKVNSILHECSLDVEVSSIRGISFYYRYECELPVHTGYWNRRIGLRLGLSDGSTIEHMPEFNWDEKPDEYRYAWVYFFMPVSALFPVKASDIIRLKTIEIVFGPQHPSDIQFAMDGFFFEMKPLQHE